MCSCTTTIAHVAPRGRDSSVMLTETVYICHAMNSLIQTSFKSMNMDPPHAQPTLDNSGINKEL